MAKTSASGRAAARSRVEAVRVARGRLAPMRSADGFREFVIEQLAGVRDLVSRRMFGGVGFYAGEVFFGILARNQLCLKVGEPNRAAYEAAGMAPFKPYPDRQVTMSYWPVPVAVLEDADELAEWVRAAVAVASAVPRAMKKRPGSAGKRAAAGRKKAAPRRKPGV